ncbi:MAG TPA: hypothetical protein VNB94_01875, partial [Mycobacteriales bacterium]|nr:hypothetical protein [Mycobacteriales bacterium]
KRGVSLGELRTQCARVKAAAEADPRATRARIHAERSCRRWDDGEGKGFATLSGPLADLLLMESHFAAARDTAFQRAYRDGRTERNDALDYDALLATIRAGAHAIAGSAADSAGPTPPPAPSRPVDDTDPSTGPSDAGRSAPGPTGGTVFGPGDADVPGPAAGTLFGPSGDTLLGPVPDATTSPAARCDDGARPTGAKPGRRVRGKWWNAKVIIRVDAAALTRGRPIAGEVCEVAGAGPIPVDDVREAIAGGGFVALVLTHATKVTGVAHLGRHPTALQRRPTTPSSTSSTRSATTTTTSKPTAAGPSSTAPASGPSFHPTTPGILGTPWAWRPGDMPQQVARGALPCLDWGDHD